MLRKRLLPQVGLAGLRMRAGSFLTPWHSFVLVFSSSVCLEINSNPVEEEFHGLCSDRRVCDGHSLGTECKEGVAESLLGSSGDVPPKLGPCLSALGSRPGQGAASLRA